MDDNTKKKLLGSIIKKERESKNITQDRLSSLIEIDPRNLSKIERGINFPSFKSFCKIVEVLKIEPNYFLNFIQFDKIKENPIDKELIASLKTLPDEIKIKINELIASLKK